MKSSSDRSAARRYARALLQSGTLEQNEPRVHALNTLSDIWKRETSLQLALLNPSVQEAQKLEVAGDLAQRLLPTDPHFANFVALLTTNKRWAMLELIAEQFKIELDSLKGRLRITVTSALDVPQEEQLELTNKLKSQFGDLASLTWETDTELIGGVVLRSGDRVFDASLAGALKRMETRLRG